jgi:hypothetical protein
MSNKRTMIANLTADINRLQPELTEARERVAEVRTKVLTLERRKEWLECPYRYGDIVEFTHRMSGQTTRYVAMSTRRIGRKIKKNGTLYAESTHMRGGYGGDTLKTVGRYDGRDLPEPGEAARFGMRNR